MKRMGMCNRLRPEKAEEYKRPHTAAWPGVLATTSACNIRNFSIFLREPEMLLFACWEYHGVDFAADAANGRRRRDARLVDVVGRYDQHP